MIAAMALWALLSAGGQNLHFYIYGSHSCSHCVMLEAELRSKFTDSTITFYPIEDSANLSNFLKLKGITGIPVIPMTAVFLRDTLRVVRGASFAFEDVLPFVKLAEDSDCVAILWSQAELLRDTTEIKALQTLFLSGRTEQQRDAHRR